MTKSELIERIVTHQGLLSSKDVELAIKTMLEQMSQCLATGDRIEIRGFGSFSLHYRAPRVGRNPKTGQSVTLDGKFVPHFKPGKELRDRVNEDEEEGLEAFRTENRYMQILVRALLGVVALAVVATTIIFILENQQPVSLAFLGWSAPQLSLSVPIILALLVGMLIGPVLSWAMGLRKKRKVGAL